MSNVWPFVPQRRLKEIIEWKTEIIRCRSAEQRICLRNAPRTTIEYDFQLLPQEIEAATYLARQYGADEILLPFWHELSYVGSISASTTNIPVDDTSIKRYQAGQSGFIIGADGTYETFTIDTVNPNSIDIASPGLVSSYVGSLVMPAYPARVTRPFNFNKFPSEYYTAQTQYVLAEDFNLTGVNNYPVFNSSFVISDRPVILGSSSETQAREFDSFSNQSGPLFYSKEFTYPVGTSDIAWSFDNKTDAWNFRLFMYDVKGKQKSFYAPRWTKDFIPSQNILSADTAIIVESNETLNDAYIGSICIVKNDGSQVYLTIDSWETVGPGEYQMNLTTMVGEDILVSEIDLICRMPRMRFNSDLIEIDYLDAEVINVRLPLFEVLE